MVWTLITPDVRGNTPDNKIKNSIICFDEERGTLIFYNTCSWNSETKLWISSWTFGNNPLIGSTEINHNWYKMLLKKSNVPSDICWVTLWTISIFYCKVHCLNKYWKMKYLKLRRQFSGCRACYTSMRIEIQILSTHINAGRIWWPSCDYDWRAPEQAGSQDKQTGEVCVKRKTMSQCTRWWVTEQDIWWQLLTSSHGHTHIHMCPHTCKQTHTHTCIHIHACMHTQGLIELNIQLIEYWSNSVLMIKK